MPRIALLFGTFLFFAIPLHVKADPLPPITPSGLAVSLTPLFTFPADNPPTNTGASARVDYVVPSPGDAGRVFANDTNGTIYTTSAAGGQTPGVYLDLNTQNVGFANVNEYDGLSGIAFNPNFAGDPSKPGYGVFYTLYAAPSDGITPTYGNAASHITELREWTATDPKAATFSGTSRMVMAIGDISFDHNGGSIGFNPTARPGSADYGNLYIALGDDGFNDISQNGQNLASPHAKLLRINPAPGPLGQPYTVPTDNPFRNTAGALPEIFAYGLRNPQSFSWDSLTGKMYINDIGQVGPEEVDVGTAGANYGWSQREGTYATGYGIGDPNPDNENIYTPLQSAASLGFTDPIAEYDHTLGDSIGSGFLYRGSAIPELYGMYVLADIVTGVLFYFDPNAAPPGGQAPLHELLVEENGNFVTLTSSYGISNDFQVSPRVDLRLSQLADGELVAALKSNGEVFALSDGIPVPEPGTATLLAGMIALLALHHRTALRYSPRYAARSRPSCASAAAGPSSATLPCSMT